MSDHAQGRRILLVRHGQSTWNAERRWQGQADPPLTDEGVAQARSAIAALGTAGPFAGVACSTLERATRTAELLAEGLGLTAPTPDAGLMERCAGDWEGLTRAEIDERYPGDVAAWRTPPGFESDGELLARVVPALAALAEAMPGDLPLLAVTHGGVMYTVESRHEPRRHHGRIHNLDGRWVEVRGGGLDDVVPVGRRLRLASSVSSDDLPPSYI